MTDPRYHDTINKTMTNEIPELHSEFARCPMAYDRWRLPDEIVDNGEPCVMLSQEDHGPQKNYIFVAKGGTVGPGYYHFRTQDAHVEAYRRWNKVSPPSRWSKEQKEARKNYYEVKRILRNRTLTSEPDDLLAARMALVQSQSKGSATKSWTNSTRLPLLVSTTLLTAGAR